MSLKGSVQGRCNGRLWLRVAHNSGVKIAGNLWHIG